MNHLYRQFESLRLNYLKSPESPGPLEAFPPSQVEKVDSAYADPADATEKKGEVFLIDWKVSRLGAKGDKNFGKSAKINALPGGTSV